MAADFLQADVRYSPRFTAAEKQLLSFSDRMRNLKALMTDAIAPETSDMLAQHWESKGAAFGTPWAPWKPSTFRARLRKGNVAKGLLDDSGALKRSLFASVRQATRLQVINGGLRLVLTPANPEQRRKFGLLLRGTRFMVARPPVPSPLPRSFRDRVRALTRDYVLTGRVRGEAGRFAGASA